MSSVQLLISSVSDEFGSYRDKLEEELDSGSASFKIQRKFKDTGYTTLLKLDELVRQCHGVLHLVGERTGSPVSQAALTDFRRRYPDLAARFPFLRDVLDPDHPTPCSYTQWEAYLAVVHDKRLFVYEAADDAKRDPPKELVEECQSQAEHLRRLDGIKQYSNRYRFTEPVGLAARFNLDGLMSMVREANEDADPAVKPNNLPYKTLGSLFKGRETFLTDLRAKLLDSGPEATTNKALYGLGGVGKTRLAVEYALKHREEYTALLFASAESPAALRANLADLCGPLVLNLPEHSTPDQNVRLGAALRWLKQHPGWILLLDNLDTPDAVAEAEKLLPHLDDGHVLLTTRIPQWDASQVEALELDVLAEDDAVAFLDARTSDKYGKRRLAADDPAVARTIVRELGQLALALEQAGAYITRNYPTVALADYLTTWRTNRAKVWAWDDKLKNLMKYDRSVAVTWQTSVNQLTPDAGRVLLERLAWLAPDPIPLSLLATPVPDAPPIEIDDARRELTELSLARFTADGSALLVHRLVQDVTRRSLQGEEARARLTEALRWVDAAFGGNPQDIRNWPVLDPLLPHALAVTAKAYTDPFGNPAPTSTLLNNAAQLLDAKAQLQQAEELMRRALAIAEASFGPNHPTVAIRLNNLASLLQTTNCLEQAEPLLRRALAIDEASFGSDHPNAATALSNLAQLLQDTNRLEQAEPLMRRALAIDEASFGPNHPDVAIVLNNLANLLQATNRLEQAAPLQQQMVSIFVAFQESTGHQHPSFLTGVNNYVALLRELGRTEADIDASLAELGIRRG